MTRVTFGSAESCRVESRYVDSVRALGRRPTWQEQLDLARAAQAGDDAARRRLIEGSLPLVLNVARRIHQRLPAGVDVMELVSIGNEALLRAVERFDPDRGIKFVTYAYLLVGRDIRRSLQYSLSQRRDRRKERPLEHAYHASVRPVIEGASADVEAIRAQLGRLSPRQREVLDRRMAGETFESIGQDYGVTRERVRQIEARALEVLREALGLEKPQRRTVHVRTWPA